MSEAIHPLRIRDYRLIWLTRFLSVNATVAVVVIIGAQVYQYARTVEGMAPKEAAFLLGLLGLAQFIPFLLLTPVAGLLADRLDRRFVAAASTAVDLFIALTLALANTYDFLSLPLLFALAAAHGGARVFIGPSVSAIVPNVVPAASLPRAIAFSSIAWQSASVIGPATAGFLLARDPALPYWYASVLLAVGICTVLLVRPIPIPPKSDAHPVRQMAEGAQFVWKERFLLGCVTLDLFAVLLGGATALLPVYARDILHVGAEGFGMLRAGPAIGATLVAMWLAAHPIRTNAGPIMFVGVAIFALATIVFGLSQTFWLSVVALAVLGGADMLSVYVRQTLVQIVTPDQMRGRVAAVSSLFIGASNELGEFRTGVAARFMGAVGAAVSGGVAALIVTGVWAKLFPALRKADRLE